MQIATVCMNSTGDRKRNTRLAFEWIEYAVKQGAQIIVLPEMFPYLGGYERLWENGLRVGDELYLELSKLALKYNVLLVAGSVPEQSEDDTKKVYNTCFVFDPKGHQIAKYRKVNLFSFNGGDQQPSYCEQDGFLQGSDLVRFSYQGWEIGLAICFDLRFPSLFQKLTKDRPLDLLIIPSAFTEQTGKAHWQLLLRARAVEYQCYVAASNQLGRHYGTRASFGHSMIIHPWGNVLSTTGENEGIATHNLDKAQVLKCKSRIPLFSK